MIPYKYHQSALNEASGCLAQPNIMRLTFTCLILLYIQHLYTLLSSKILNKLLNILYITWYTLSTRSKKISFQLLPVASCFYTYTYPDALLLHATLHSPPQHQHFANSIKSLQLLQYSHGIDAINCCTIKKNYSLLLYATEHKNMSDIMVLPNLPINLYFL